MHHYTQIQTDNSTYLSTLFSVEATIFALSISSFVILFQFLADKYPYSYVKKFFLNNFYIKGYVFVSLINIVLLSYPLSSHCRPILMLNWALFLLGIFLSLSSFIRILSKIDPEVMLKTLVLTEKEGEINVNFELIDHLCFKSERSVGLRKIEIISEYLYQQHKYIIKNFSTIKNAEWFLEEFLRDCFRFIEKFLDERNGNANYTESTIDSKNSGNSPVEIFAHKFLYKILEDLQKNKSRNYNYMFISDINFLFVELLSVHAFKNWNTKNISLNLLPLITGTIGRYVWRNFLIAEYVKDKNIEALSQTMHHFLYKSLVTIEKNKNKYSVVLDPQTNTSINEIYAASLRSCGEIFLSSAHGEYGEKGLNTFVMGVLDIENIIINKINYNISTFVHDLGLGPKENKEEWEMYVEYLKNLS